MTPPETPQIPSYLSALQLESQAFTDVKITAQNDTNSGELLTNVNFGGSMLGGDKRKWQLLVRVNLTPGENSKPTYLGSVECVGIFFGSTNCSRRKH